MRRLAILFAGAAVWLFLLAIPAFADGGPHVASVNSGAGTYGTGTGLSNNVLTSDNCAGCHRAHTAQAFDITRSEVPGLCLTCHGAAGTGATTNVEEGVQYATTTAGQFTRNTGTELGALRAGGFVSARLDSSDPGRISTPRFSSGAWATSFSSNVPALATSVAVTSRHMDINNVTSAKVWGNGVIGSGTAQTMQLNCTSCHNPHGNGNYRILNPVPETDENVSGGGFAITNAAGVVVKDALPAASTLATASTLGANVRNYTILQNNVSGVNALLTAADVVAGGYSATDGDYFRRYVPWYRNATWSGSAWTQAIPIPSSTSHGDSPTGLAYSGSLYTTPTYIADSFSNELSAWCAQCHNRYHTGLNPSSPVTTNGSGQLVGALSQQNPSGDADFNYRHGTINNGCQVCHVAHGSNAVMAGDFSQAQTMPDGGAAPMGATDSRLLKVDNRGTCQACHDPTGTVSNGIPAGSLTNSSYTGTVTPAYSGPSTPNYPTP